MNIKSKLSFQFTLIVIGILLFFSVLVYYFSFTTQRAKYRQNLYNRAKNTISLLVNVKEIDTSLLKKIHQSTFNWINEEIAVADSNSSLIYNNNLNYLTRQMIKQNISRRGAGFFSIAEKDGVYYEHHKGNKKYHVFVVAYDKYRYENLKELKEILFWSIIFSIWLSVLLSYLFSKRALQPISYIIRSVKDINSYKLSTRLNEGNRKDEIERLAMTFNEMLANLELSFRNQEEFVSNASHELRTPLTIMILESDYFISKSHTAEEYREHTTQLVNDLKKMNEQLTSLLELAQMNNEKSISLGSIRIDEVIFNAIGQIKPKYPSRRIIPKIEYPENEKELLTEGNFGLLLIAFKNLIDNACKFSNEDVVVLVGLHDDFIKVEISDKGIGIPTKEINSIYKPFSRGSNVRFKAGFGIGLALVSRIFYLHNVELIVKSQENQGSQFNLKFRRVQH
jgi:signal transduction histidine kinase